LKCTRKYIPGIQKGNCYSEVYSKEYIGYNSLKYSKRIICSNLVKNIPSETLFTNHKPTKEYISEEFKENLRRTGAFSNLTYNEKTLLNVWIKYIGESGVKGFLNKGILNKILTDEDMDFTTITTIKELKNSLDQIKNKFKKVTCFIKGNLKIIPPDKWIGGNRHCPNPLKIAAICNFSAAFYHIRENLKDSKEIMIAALYQEKCKLINQKEMAKMVGVSQAEVSKTIKKLNKLALEYLRQKSRPFA